MSTVSLTTSLLTEDCSGFLSPATEDARFPTITALWTVGGAQERLQSICRWVPGWAFPCTRSPVLLPLLYHFVAYTRTYSIYRTRPSTTRGHNTAAARFVITLLLVKLEGDLSRLHGLGAGHRRRFLSVSRARSLLSFRRRSRWWVHCGGTGWLSDAKRLDDQRCQIRRRNARCSLLLLHCMQEHIWAHCERLPERRGLLDASYHV